MRRRLSAFDGCVSRRVALQDPNGGVGSGHDHGVHRHLQLGLTAQPETASTVDQPGYGRNRCRGRSHP